jgi:hypothetical protein
VEQAEVDDLELPAAQLGPEPVERLAVLRVEREVPQLEGVGLQVVELLGAMKFAGGPASSPASASACQSRIVGISYMYETCW